MLRVGALVRDDRCRIFLHRRSPDRRQLPGFWDIVGGQVEPGETPEAALARQLAHETGWRLRRIEAAVTDLHREDGGVVRREVGYLVEVDGDLAAPRLREGQHDAYAWVGPDDLELMIDGHIDGGRRLRALVAKACRIRLTDRLRLEPIGLEHANDLWRLHSDEGVARWFGGQWSREFAREWAAGAHASWQVEGVGKWIAYLRSTGDLVGRGGVSRREIAGVWRLELGWALRSPYWGRGYATEIGRAGLGYAFGHLGAEEVMAFAKLDNLRSHAVMERLGMRYLGEIPEWELVDGRDGVYGGIPFALYAVNL